MSKSFKKLKRSRLLLRSCFGISLMLLVTASVSPVVFAEQDRVYYVCGCGENCACGTIAKAPGECSCGKKLVAMALLTVEKDIALFCPCAGGCACERSRENPDLCGCGKPLRKIGVKGRYTSKGCLCGGLEYTLDL